MRKDIFISYSSLDKEFAIQLAKDLRTKNIKVWLDAWDIGYGSNISSEIGKGLVESSYLLVVISENSLRSKWVETEWTAKFGEEVSNEEVMVIPTLIGEIKENDIPIILRGKKRANFSTNYEEELEQFVEFLISNRKSSFFEETLDGGLQELIKKGMLESVGKTGLSELDSIISRFEASKGMVAARRKRIVVNEINYHYKIAAEREASKKKDFDSDPDGAEFLMMLMVGREEMVLRGIKNKILHIVESGSSDDEVVEDIEFELKCQREEMANLR